MLCEVLQRVKAGDGLLAMLAVDDGAMVGSDGDGGIYDVVLEGMDAFDDGMVVLLYASLLKLRGKALVGRWMFGKGEGSAGAFV